MGQEKMDLERTVEEGRCFVEQQNSGVGSDRWNKKNG
jgi:KaiC/GvpD/RAD55 family RecA-like ATPase